MSCSSPLTFSLPRAGAARGKRGSRPGRRPGRVDGGTHPEHCPDAHGNFLLSCLKELISGALLHQARSTAAPAKDTPTSLSAACRTIVYSLVEVASLQGELNSANRTSEGPWLIPTVFRVKITRLLILFDCLLLQRSIAWLKRS